MFFKFARGLREIVSSARSITFLLRGAIVHRTAGTHKNLYIYLFLLTIYVPIYLLWPPVNRTSGRLPVPSNKGGVFSGTTKYGRDEEREPSEKPLFDVLAPLLPLFRENERAEKKRPHYPGRNQRAFKVVLGIYRYISNCVRHKLFSFSAPTT